MFRPLPAVLMALVLLSHPVLGRAQDATPAGSPPAGCPIMTEDENAAIARRWHEEAINTHDLTVLDELLAPNPPTTRPPSRTTRGRGKSSARS